MDFGRAVSYIRQDPGWLVKVILGSIITFIPILNFAAVGYSLDVTRNVYEGRETPLPEWGDDFGGRLVRGLIATVISLIYVLPIIVIGILFGILSGGLAASMDSGEAAGGAIGALALCFIPILFIGGIVLGLVAMVAQARYALTRDFGAALRFGEVFAEFRNNIGSWLMVILFMIIVQVALSFLVGLCGIGLFFLLYGMLVQAHLVAQAHRQSTGGMITEPARL